MTPITAEAYALNPQIYPSTRKLQYGAIFNRTPAEEVSVCVCVYMRGLREVLYALSYHIYSQYTLSLSYTHRSSTWKSRKRTLSAESPPTPPAMPETSGARQSEK